MICSGRVSCENGSANGLGLSGSVRSAVEEAVEREVSEGVRVRRKSEERRERVEDIFWWCGGGDVRAAGGFCREPEQRERWEKHKLLGVTGGDISYQISDEEPETYVCGVARSLL